MKPVRELRQCITTRRERRLRKRISQDAIKLIRGKLTVKVSIDLSPTISIRDCTKQQIHRELHQDPAIYHPEGQI